jgi:hypothetical protein
MIKIFSLTILLISLCSNNCFGYTDLDVDYNQFNNLNTAQVENFIIGFWGNGFPVGSGHNVTYEFRKDYSFEFNAVSL